MVDDMKRRFRDMDRATRRSRATRKYVYLTWTKPRRCVRSGVEDHNNPWEDLEVVISLYWSSQKNVKRRKAGVDVDRG